MKKEKIYLTCEHLEHAIVTVKRLTTELHCHLTAQLKTIECQQIPPVCLYTFALFTLHCQLTVA